MSLFPETDLESGATFSPDRLHRYTLWRRWADGPTVMFVGLNPSTADETLDDPTIRRCIGFAKKWGYGCYVMTNIFAYRATDPKDMKAFADPVGPENDKALLTEASKAKLVIAAWGIHGVFMDRGKQVASFLPNLQCLGVTKEGYPKHPLYLRGDSMPEPYGGLKVFESISITEPVNEGRQGFKVSDARLGRPEFKE